MSLRNNRVGVRALKLALESLNVNKHDDVNDDTPREMDPDAGDKPVETATPVKEGEITNATPPKKEDVITRENLDEDGSVVPAASPEATVVEVPIVVEPVVSVKQDEPEGVAAIQEDKPNEAGDLVDGVSDAGAGTIVQEEQYPENVQAHVEPTVENEDPVSTDPEVTTAIAEGEVTTDPEVAAVTGEVVVEPTPEGEVETEIVVDTTADDPNAEAPAGVDGTEPLNEQTEVTDSVVVDDTAVDPAAIDPTTDGDQVDVPAEAIVADAVSEIQAQIDALTEQLKAKTAELATVVSNVDVTPNAEVTAETPVVEASDISESVDLEGTTSQESLEPQTAEGNAGVTEDGPTGGNPAIPEGDQPADGADPAGEMGEVKPSTEDAGETAVGEAGVSEGEDTGSNPAVPDEAQPADGGDPAGGEEPREPENIPDGNTVSGEITDPTLEIEDHGEQVTDAMENLEEAVNDLGFVEREIERVQDQLETGGMDRNDAERLEDSMESIARRHKLSFRPNLPSLESFDAGPATRIRQTGLSLESLEQFRDKLVEVIIKAYNYIAKLINDGYTYLLGKFQNVSKTMDDLRGELNGLQANPNAPATIEAANLARILAVGEDVPADIGTYIRKVQVLANQLARSGKDLNPETYVRLFQSGLKGEGGRPTELIESIVKVGSVSELKAQSGDGVVEYKSETLIGNKQVFVNIPDSDWESLDPNKLAAGVRSVGEVKSTTVTLPSIANAVHIASFGKTINETLQDLRQRAENSKRVADRIQNGLKSEDGEASPNASKVIGLAQRVAVLSGQPHLDYARYLVVLGVGLTSLLKTVVKVHKTQA